MVLLIGTMGQHDLLVLMPLGHYPRPMALPTCTMVLLNFICVLSHSTKITTHGPIHALVLGTVT